MQGDRASTGPIGFTTFIHPTAHLQTTEFSIGEGSLIEAFVSLEGQSARVGSVANLQDNDRLLNFTAEGRTEPGDLVIGDGAFTAHGVTFIGSVRIGEACGTVINAVVQNARVGDASIVGPMARILGPDPDRPIEIPDSSMVMFGAQITSQEEVEANVIPVPAPFSLFCADVDEENMVLARGFNLLSRAAARMSPFSAEPDDPRNPGPDFPGMDEAFGKFSIAPPTVYRRGTGVIPARPATMGDLGFERFEPLNPASANHTPSPDSPDAGARFIVPRVASPELVDEGAVVLGGCDLAEGVVVGAGTYLHAADAPAVSVGAGTRVGQNCSLHQLSLTSCVIGGGCTIGDRVVLHGPLIVGDNVRIGDGAALFGPRIRDGVTVGAGALVFGPVEVESDVPPGAIVVAPGMESLVAPSAPGNQGTLPRSNSMVDEWEQTRDH